MTEITIRQLQDYIRAKDHRPEHKDKYFLKLIEEVGELAKAMRKDNRMQGDDIKGTIEEELYDVLYYVMALANLYGVDLGKCARLKERLNQVKYGHGVGL